MKKLISLLLVLAMVLALAACGGNSDATTTAPNGDNGLVVDTKILMEADNDMLNTYSVLAVNPQAPFVDADGNPVSDVAVNTAGADALYQWLVSREALDIAGASHDELPTDERIRAFNERGNDIGLVTLYYQFGRYLLICSSREDNMLPANLQGLWNKEMKAPWNADYHSNINLQMNYWPAGPTGLVSCMEPLCR